MFSNLTGILADPGSSLIKALLLSFLLILIPPKLAWGESTSSEENSKLFINPVFQKVTTFSESRAAVKHNGRWGIINRSGTFVHPPEFQALRAFREGRAPVRKSEQWGFVNKSGTGVIEPRFQDVHSFSNGLAPVKKNGKWGYVNRDGQTVINHRFGHARPFSNGLGLVRYRQQKGFINRNGKFVIPSNYNDARSFRNGLAPVEKNDLWGYITRGDTWKITNRFTWASPFHEGVARVLKQGQWALIDRSGSYIDTFPYRFIHHSYQQRILFRHQGKIGYLNRSGDVVIDNRFQAGTHFQNGLAAVKTKGQWGFINRQGQWAIPPSFDIVSKFKNGFAAAKKNEHWGFLRNPSNTVSNKKQVKPPAPSPVDPIDSKTSLVKEFPLWRSPDEEVYVSLGKGLTKREWHFKREEEIRTYGLSALIYEVTRFPYQLPTFFQREAAEALYTQSIQAVQSRQWTKLKQGLSSGYTPNFKGGSHYHNVDFILSKKTLVPLRPEYLLYNTTPEERKELNGFMFLMSSVDATGPQIGGPLTIWHYHKYREKRCYQARAIIFPKAKSCKNGTWLKESPEMIHVWFIDHPSGHFGTRMRLPPKMYDVNYKNKFFKDSRDVKNPF